MLIMSRGGGVSDGHQAAAVRLLLDIMSSIMRRARIAPASILRLRKGWSGSLSMARAAAPQPPPVRVAAFAGRDRIRYSAIVRTTLEVGRVSPPPPGPFTSLRTCSS
jgi:hypothetical protein